MRFRLTVLVAILSGVGILALLLVLNLGSGGKKPQENAQQNLVATFAGGVITTAQLKEYAAEFIPQCHQSILACGSLKEASSCGKDKTCAQHKGKEESCCRGEHGGTHAGCCGESEKALASQPCEEHESCCLQHSNLTAENYRDVIKAMVLEHMIREKIRQKGIGEAEETKDLLKYLSEGIYLTSTHLQMEDKMRPSEREVRQYYEENQGQYKDRTLNEVRGEITRVLKEKKHQEYMPKYVAELKKNALIKKYPELLRVESPEERELRNYYRWNRDRFVQRERVKIQQIQTATREEAERALIKLKSGEDFSEIAKRYSQGPYAQSGGEVPYYIERKKRGRQFDDQVFRLYPGGVSRVFQEGENYYIVKVKEKQAQRQKSFPEAAEEIKAEILQEREKRLFEEMKHKNLFVVNGQPYTVGDFQRIYEKLPRTSRKQYQGLEEKERLMDQLIEYELLVQDARHRGIDAKTREEMEEVKGSLLEREFYYQEVVSKLGLEDISREEASRYFEKNKSRFVEPPKAKISYVRVSTGPG
ncbi:MAG: peptidyl-prolyl cis-trans isomerase, partial [bacterium]